MKAILPFVIIVAVTLSACTTVKTNTVKANSSPAPAAQPSVSTDANANKLLVTEFYELPFNHHQPAEAAAKFMAPRYIQHNPAAPDGAETFVTFFEGYFQTHPTAHVQIKRVLADGDLVAVHAHWSRDETDRGSAVVDILRIENGKIAEHWDVVQSVPERSLNSNTMF
jgi:predicted SnoaL-like aldol condensation-catalyzing enzyme